MDAKEIVDARKTSIGRKEALALAGQVDEIFASKGTKTVHMDLRQEHPDSDTLAGILLGPTGNLRAPAVRHGRRLFVGFSEEAYKKLLK